MHLQQLTIKHFRNYDQLDLTFSSENNVFIGENGSGKTNLLEALHVLSLLHSFRVNKDDLMIESGEDTFYIKGQIKRNGEKKTLEIGYSPSKRQLKVDGKDIKKVSDYIGHFPVQTFLQSDINLILGSPGLRRRMLDHTLSLCFPDYVRHLQAYNKAIRQRNAALKQQSAQYQLWDNLLIDHGAAILLERIKLIQEINSYCQNYYQAISGREVSYQIKYKTFLETENNISLQIIKTALSKRLQSYQSREERYGHTLIGPHTEDIDYLFKGFKIREHGSQGQMRLAILSFKLSLNSFIENKLGVRPALLLDDILNDLDHPKRQRFFEKIKDYQSFFTSTSLEGLKSIAETSKLFEVKAGQVFPIKD